MSVPHISECLSLWVIVLEEQVDLLPGAGWLHRYVLRPGDLKVEPQVHQGMLGCGVLHTKIGKVTNTLLPGP